MKGLTKCFKSFGSERGTAMVEYALIASLVSVALIVMITALNRQVNTGFQKIEESLGAGTVVTRTED